MAFRTIKIGDITEQYRKTCLRNDLTIYDVCGISAKKEFFSPARQIAEDTSDYKIVPEGCFACNFLHVGRDKVLPVALNRDNSEKIVSSNYYVFKFRENPYILKEFFFILLLSDDIDRYFSYYTEASVRDRVDWKTFCDTKLRVPPLEEQEKIVCVYEALRENIGILKRYNNSLSYLTSELLEKITQKRDKAEMKELIELSENQNSENKLGTGDLYGISTDKTFCRSMSDVKKVNLSAFFIVKPNYFAFNEITSRNKERLSVALNLTGQDILVSNRYRVFRVNSDKITEEFLYLYLSRDEFDRFARYHSWGCAREMFSWEDFLLSEIPVPTLQEQKLLSELFHFQQFKKKKLERYEVITKQFCSFVFKKYCA